MPRNGSGVYSLPAGLPVNGDLSDATDDIRTPLSDLEADMNAARPIVAGGTGATNAADARSNLGIVSFPPGGIILWSGSVAAIPSGWALCDGTNGTPNLTDRFIVGAGNTYAVGNSGGSTTKTIAEANLPAHTHGGGTLAAASGGAHTHSVTDSGHTHSILTPYGTATAGSSYPEAQANATYIPNGANRTSASGSFGPVATSGLGALVNQAATTGISVASGGAHTHTISGATGSTGSGTALDILPPYYALAYIMKL